MLTSINPPSSYTAKAYLPITATGRRRRVRSLSSYQHPIRRDETGYRCGISRIRARSRNQVMAVPTSQTDRTAIGRGISRTNSRSPALRSISRAVANQIGIVVRNPSRVARWLNIWLRLTVGLVAISCLRSLTVMSSALRASKIG